MARSPLLSALEELADGSTLESQLKALRTIKNEVVGYEQRKELVVRHGVVKLLAGILRTEARRGRKRRYIETRNGHISSRKDLTIEWGSEEELRYQATLVVGSLAHGGTALVAPLLAGNVVPPLLEALDPTETSSQLITATLRALNAIVDAASLERLRLEHADGPVTSSLLDTVRKYIYTEPVIKRLSKILSRCHPENVHIYQAISLTANLITKTCQQESDKSLLVEWGILDQLAANLAGAAARDAPWLRMEIRTFAAEAELPENYLPDILDAAAAIIKNSSYNTARLVYSNRILQVFGLCWDGDNEDEVSQWAKLSPRLHTFQNKSDSYARIWPALTPTNLSTTDEPVSQILRLEGRTFVSDEPESPLFVWLTAVARRSDFRARASACWLLALLNNTAEKWGVAEPSRVTRERHFAVLVVPLVVEMIKQLNAGLTSSKTGSRSMPASTKERRHLLERSMLILSELVVRSRPQQNAAYEGKILPVLFQILKRSFDPITVTSTRLWSPKTEPAQVPSYSIDKASSTLGSPGLNLDVQHAFRSRTRAFDALAAMAESQDPIRKAEIDQGIMKYIVDSMNPFTAAGASDPSECTDESTISMKGGNPTHVILAACKAAKMLTRSVYLLRTSLIDADISVPLKALLKYPDTRVQVAATEALTNLLMDLSPLHDKLKEPGLSNILLEHCRSANFQLRLDSMWALKHLVLSCPLDVKTTCFNKLGVDYLAQLLSAESSRAAPAFGMGVSNAAGEKVDILNSVADEPKMDLDEEFSSDEEDDQMADSTHSIRRLPNPGNRQASAASIRERLQQIKAEEQDTRLTAEHEAIRLQEQALDFVRNFMADVKCPGDVIEHVLRSFGQSRFYDLLDLILRPKGSPSSTTSSSSNSTAQPRQTRSSTWSRTQQFTSSSDKMASSAFASQPTPNWSLYAPHEILHSALMILVHIANGGPRQRASLCSQTQLLSHVLVLFRHPHRQVRANCASFLNNLTFFVDQGDIENGSALERVKVLRQMGFEEAAQTLNDDPDQDIRELVRVALDQFRTYGEGGPANGAHGSGGGGNGNGGQGQGQGRSSSTSGSYHHAGGGSGGGRGGSGEGNSGSGGGRSSLRQGMWGSM